MSLHWEADRASPASSASPPGDSDPWARRVAERLARAPRTHAGRPVLDLMQALLLANDLHLLGLLDEAPSLRWRVADAVRALAAWQVHVVGELPESSASDEAAPAMD
jgi:hypothetical protein